VSLSFNLAPGEALGRCGRKRQGVGDPHRHAPAASSAIFPATRLNSPNRGRPALADPGRDHHDLIVLGVLYESYIHPITSFPTLPSAGVGAILALMLFDRTCRSSA